MQDKPDGFEDKAVKSTPEKKPRRKKPIEVDKETWVKPSRRGWDDESFQRAMEGNLTPGPSPTRRGEEGVTIRMRMGRQWMLDNRLLRPGEVVTVDAMTAELIVNTGYAVYVEG